MKTRHVLPLLAVICLSIFSLAQINPPYGALPLTFEPNVGQSDARVKFLSHANGYTLFLTSTEAVMSARGTHRVGVAPSTRSQMQQIDVVRLRLLGANLQANVEGVQPLPGKSNYFTGNAPASWRTNIPHYARVRYRDIYAGVDLVYYGNDGRLESDFIIGPGANPNNLKLAVEGASARIDAQGNLVLAIAKDDIRLLKPVVYQEVNGRRLQIGAAYQILGDHEVHFRVDPYDVTKALVIDPVLAYSTYLGGTGGDNGNSIAVDSSGAAYVTGSTLLSFPTTAGAYQRNCPPSGTGNCFGTVFVTKLNAKGSNLIYSTFIGGSGTSLDGGFGDSGQAIAVDSSGNAYITGATYSSDFPVTAGAFQTKFTCCMNQAPESDAFVTKLSSDGSHLLYSSFLAGSDGASGRAIAIDKSGNAYVSGITPSTNFPTTTGAFEPTTPTPSASCSDTGIFPCTHAFAAKLNSLGSTLVYSTYLAGTQLDAANGIALDSSGDAYIAGMTISPNFPVTAGAFQTACKSDGTGGCFRTGFVTKLNASGSAEVYSTYLGGSGNSTTGAGSQADAIALDSLGEAYIAGATQVTDFPVTAGAFQTTCKSDPNFACNDPFVSKLNSLGSKLVYSTYLGAGAWGDFFGIGVDKFQQAYIGGGTDSVTFPITSNAPDKVLNSSACGSGVACPDGFVTTLNSSGTAIVYYSTFLGGSNRDYISGLALDSAQNVYVTGLTSSTDFPVTSSAYQRTIHSGQSAFISKLVIAGDLAVTLSALPNPVSHGANLTYTISVKNNGPDASSGDTITDAIPGGTTFVSFSNTNGSCTHPAVGTMGTLQCTRSSLLLAGHSWGPITLTVKVNAFPGSIVTDTAHVTAKTQDTVQSNNTATVTVKVQ